MMPDTTIRKLLVTTAATMALLLPGAVRAQDSGVWTAIDPTDLKLEDNPKQRGGPAMVLDYWHDINNRQSNETLTIRIKVFREQGTKYAKRRDSLSCKVYAGRRHPRSHRHYRRGYPQISLAA
jgi:hypothetical protein